MTNLAHNKELFYKLLQGLFRAIGENTEDISDLLIKFKRLRKEHSQMLIEDVIGAINKARQKDETMVSDTKWLLLLEKLSTSLHESQKKAYNFLENDIAQDRKSVV